MLGDIGAPQPGNHEQTDQGNLVGKLSTFIHVDLPLRWHGRDAAAILRDGKPRLSPESPTVRRCRPCTSANEELRLCQPPGSFLTRVGGDRSPMISISDQPDFS